MPFDKVLVANRGEIAVRIIRALREAGIRSVAVFSDADRASLHVRMADEAVHIGPAPSSESYLRIDKIVAAAKATRAEAIHPGYGFLSENADFAQACADAGVIFIGPPADAIRAVGSKTRARKLARDADVPVLPGSLAGISSFEEGRELAARIGYPVMLKASAGGGGKGMRRVDSEGELAAALRDASSEAGRAFGNSDVYIEKLIEKPRHIEIQILGDKHGKMLHLGERECSIQRRHQKVIEECPSPFVSQHPALRREMGCAAVDFARAAGYYNAGTVEFLVDSANSVYYFLEMNTRLQVEHPVTELVTGLDLVQYQLRIAAGEPLDLQQDDITWRGAAIECRLGAEDADNQFFPSPGLIRNVTAPGGPGIRLDSGVYPGWTVPMEYDPLLAKLVVWAPTRNEAISRMARALDETRIEGIKTNTAFLREIIGDAEFAAGALHTGFIPEFFERRKSSTLPSDTEFAQMVAALAESRKTRTAATPERAAAAGSNWLIEGRNRRLR
ncbi:MAG TPA: acetyl-CoA carboxylase biotin carboxylase subunit [Bryobacteraceae bacterium]|nr:acetyl-CoA carboxylase biotin carboxylase subunit [Bryobacteraceae bacterium]